jgi:hypothetical protein
MYVLLRASTCPQARCLGTYCDEQRTDELGFPPTGPLVPLLGVDEKGPIVDGERHPWPPADVLQPAVCVQYMSLDSPGSVTEYSEIIGSKVSTEASF